VYVWVYAGLRVLSSAGPKAYIRTGMLLLLSSTGFGAWYFGP
jgi:hypothetical protein